MIENVSILLKEMYPLEHDGLLPNLEDILDLLTDFSLVVDYVEKMKQIPEFTEK